MNSYIKVGNTDLPQNTTFSAKWNDLDSEETGRSTGTGVLNRERIRAAVWEVDVECSMLTDAEVVALRQLFSPAEITVSFWVGEWITAQMYGAQGSVNLVSNAGGAAFWNFSISLTEF